jgi:hypothetical protein
MKGKLASTLLFLGKRTMRLDIVDLDEIVKNIELAIR